MKLTKSRKIAVIAVLSAAVSVPAAFAILGLGDIVFDPSNFGKLVEQLTQMERQYTQMVQTYQMVTAQYNQMIWMAKMVPANVRAHYRALITPWRNSSATNTYGTTGGWIAAINTGTGVPGGYQQAIQQLNAYGAALSDIPADQIDRVKTSYATVELTDGANESGMDLVGRLRSNAPEIESAIQSLEEDSLSTDPDLNTEVSVLNKINATNLIALRNGQDTNKLLVALTEQQIIDAKRKRDVEATAINSHIQFVAQEQSVLRAQTGDPSARMLAYRIP
jgi:hypothetical protein